MKTHRTSLAPVLAATLAVACSDDAAPATTPTVTYETTVRFRATEQFPKPGEVPFPSDLYLRADPDGTVSDRLEDWTNFGVQGSGSLTFSEGYGAIDGFGRLSGASFVVDGPGTVSHALPPVAADAASPAYTIVDVDPASPTRGARVPAAAGYDAQLHVITVQPDGVALEAGRQYAVVLTTRIATTRGALGPSPEFAAIRDNRAGARTSRAGMLYGAAVDAVVTRASIARDAIASVAVFTTQTTHRQLRALRDALVMGRFGDAPQLNTNAAMAAPYNTARFGADAHDGWNATLDAWMGAPPRDAMGRDVPGLPSGNEPATMGISHDAIGAVISGTFVSPEFRRAAGSSADRTEGTFRSETSDIQPVNRAKVIPLTLVLPRSAPPAAGWPVVIFGHGLGGQRRTMLSIANELARAGVATIGVDTATFGQRADNQQADRTSLFAGRGMYTGPDGLPDAQGYDNTAFFGGLRNFLGLRDNIRQTALDYAQLRRLVANPALDLSSVAAQYPGATLRLDGARVGYAGISLGGIIGTVFAAIEPTVNPVFLDVPGGGLVNTLAVDSPYVGQTLALAAGAVYGFPRDAVIDRFHPLPNLIQGILDGGDPTSYAADVTAATDGHDVYMTMVEWDDVVPNRSNELLARAMKLAVLQPSPRMPAGLATVAAPARGNASGRTQVLLMQSPAGHGDNLAQRYNRVEWQPPFPRDGTMGAMFVAAAHPFVVRQPVVAFQRSMVRFFTTAWAGAGMATADATGMEPLLDYDDDGWTDDEERAMSTDAYDPTAHPQGAAPHTRDVGFTAP